MLLALTLNFFTVCMLKKWEATDSEMEKLDGDVLKYAPSRKGGGGRHRSSDVHLFIEVELFVLVSKAPGHLINTVACCPSSVHLFPACTPHQNDVVLTSV